MYVHEYESVPGSHLAESPPAAGTCRLLEIFDGFDVGDYRLKPAHYERLMAVARTMPGLARLRQYLRIEGHTDRSGADRMNEGLSLNRAAEVQTFLSRLGGAGGMEVIGVGEARPIASNDTAEGRRRNRRVEISLCQLPPPPPPQIPEPPPMR